MLLEDKGAGPWDPLSSTACSLVLADKHLTQWRSSVPYVSQYTQP